MQRFWLMKSEPDVYGWDDLCAAGEGVWDGVRNHQAKANLLAMRVDDEAFFYHSNIGREIVGVVRISEEQLIDPTDASGRWAAVKVVPLMRLPKPVSLATMKQDDRLSNMQLLRQSRLSVSAVTDAEWMVITGLGGL